MCVCVCMCACCCSSLTQGLLFMGATALYLLRRPEYLGFMILSMLLSWVNLLYFARGTKRMGVYSVMIQKVGSLLTAAQHSVAAVAA